MKRSNLFAILDEMFATGLDTDVNTFNEVIEECTYWEGLFMILAVSSGKEDKIKKAKEIFNSYKEE